MIRQGEMKPRPTWTRRDLLTPSLGDPPRLRVVSGIGVEEAPPDANMNVGRGRPVAPDRPSSSDPRCLRMPRLGPASRAKAMTKTRPANNRMPGKSRDCIGARQSGIMPMPTHHGRISDLP
jgi:hypothetical protein